jgi:uncharacterized protein
MVVSEKIDSSPGKSCKLRRMEMRQIMRDGRLILVTLLALLALPAVTMVLAAPRQFPSPTGHVNDLAGVVDEATRTRLETLLTRFENQTGAQLAVVTIKSLEGEPIEEYANALYRAWGIGAKSGEKKDQGALLLIAIEDRRTRLEVGYGLEGDLPDGLAGELIRRMRPFLKEGNHSQAVWVGMRSIVDTLAERWQVPPGALDENGDRQYAWKKKQRGGSISPFVIVVVLVLILAVIAIIARFFRGGGGGTGGRGGAGDLWWLAPIIFNGSGGSFGGGSRGGQSGWGDSGGGSDWGGFGGGSSGGGGASDSW